MVTTDVLCLHGLRGDYKNEVDIGAEMKKNSGKLIRRLKGLRTKYRNIRYIFRERR